jgi:glutamate-ammonia-ligase adenylyltransferase
VATSLASFRSYQMDEAWTWEHLALTRARVITGDRALGDDVEAARREILQAKTDSAKVIADTAEMRARIFAAKAPDGAWEAKIGPGRLQDVELLAQSCALRLADPGRRVEQQLRAAVRAGLLSRGDDDMLQAAYRFFWRLQAGGRLLTDGPLDMEAIGEGGRAFLLRETAMSDLEALRSQLTGHVARVAEIVARGLGQDVARV